MRARLGGERRGSGVRLLVGLAVVAAVVMVLDARSGSPLDPARAAVGAVVGPVESTAGAAVRPIQAIGSTLRSNADLRHHVARLESQNSDLRSQLATTPVDRNRLAAYDGLARAAHDTGYALVPAHVVAIGAAASFTRTVTIDAGTTSGVTAGSTVLTGDGLVGRVLRATGSTATVLLIADEDSVVGARLGSTMQIGFLRGRGVVGSAGRLDLHLVDGAVTPEKGDTVVTWGSGRGGPYVAGIPVGRVVAVRNSPRESSRDAVIAPYVDLGALDLVGVVVPASTTGDRTLVTAGGGLR